jgi:hypothetical protein
LTGGQPETVWTNQLFGNHVSTSVLWDGALYGFDGRINRRGGAMRCVEAATGEILWSDESLKGSLTLASEKLLILTDEGELVIGPVSKKGFTPGSRAKLLNKPCWTPPILSNGLLYCRSGRGRLLCLDLRAKDQAARH